MKFAQMVIFYIMPVDAKIIMSELVCESIRDYGSHSRVNKSNPIAYTLTRE